jgi:hypothetical protein
MRSDWRCGLRFVGSDPCAQKKAQGWGTDDFWIMQEEVRGR